MSDTRRSRPKDRDARDIRLWLLPEAWNCLVHIAQRSGCSVAEVIETALDDWAEATRTAMEATEGLPVVAIGRFDVVKRREE